MTPFFSTTERLAALEAAAQAWLGTRYVQSGAVRGCGASCHRLGSAVLADAGFNLAAPERGRVQRAGFLPAMLAWLDQRPDLFRLPSLTETDLAAGDILVCDLGIGHIALYLGDGRVMQVLANRPAHILSLRAGPAEYVVAVYRPLETTS